MVVCQCVLWHTSCMHCFISSMSPSPAAFRSNAVASKQIFPGNFFSVLPFAVFSIPFFSFFSSFEIRLLWPSDNGKSTWGDDGESRSWGFVAASRNTRASSSTCSFVFLFKRTNRRLNESIWACREWTCSYATLMFHVTSSRTFSISLDVNRYTLWWW